MHSYVTVLQTYMTALGQNDCKTIKSLFDPKGKVHSPWLGEMVADKFFDRIAGASKKNVITPIDIFVGTSVENHAAAYFQYDWTVRDGTLITFKVIDLFTFKPSSLDVISLILSMIPIPFA